MLMNVGERELMNEERDGDVESRKGEIQKIELLRLKTFD